MADWRCPRNGTIHETRPIAAGQGLNCAEFRPNKTICWEKASPFVGTPSSSVRWLDTIWMPEAVMKPKMTEWLR